MPILLHVVAAGRANLAGDFHLADRNGGRVEDGVGLAGKVRVADRRQTARAGEPAGLGVGSHPESSVAAFAREFAAHCTARLLSGRGQQPRPPARQTTKANTIPASASNPPTPIKTPVRV